MNSIKKKKKKPSFQEEVGIDYITEGENLNPPFFLLGVRKTPILIFEGGEVDCKKEEEYPPNPDSRKKGM